MKCSFTILFIFLNFTIAVCQDNYFDMSIVYHTPDMDSVSVDEFKYQDTLKAYMFKPKTWETNLDFPCVIFTSAFTTLNKPIQAKPLRQWARLLAANGIAAVIYEVDSPVNNFDNLFNHITTNSSDLKIDTSKIALWSFSGHTPLGISKVNETDKFVCHVIYYGIAVTASSEHLKSVEKMSARFGFTYNIDSIYTSTTPNFIVRAGKDSWKLVLMTTDEFINELLSKNISFELLNYSNGQHSFDVYDNNSESVIIMLKTIEYLKNHFNK